MKMSRGPFFKVCLFVYVCLFFSLFETSEICLWCTKMEISTKKKAFHEKVGKCDFAPSEKYSSYATV